MMCVEAQTQDGGWVCRYGHLSRGVGGMRGGGGGHAVYCGGGEGAGGGGGGVGQKLSVCNFTTIKD